MLCRGLAENAEKSVSKRKSIENIQQQLLADQEDDPHHRTHHMPTFHLESSAPLLSKLSVCSMLRIATQSDWYFNTVTVIVLFQ